MKNSNKNKKSAADENDLKQFIKENTKENEALKKIINNLNKHSEKNNSKRKK